MCFGDRLRQIDWWNIRATFVGLYLLAVSMNAYIDPRSRLARIGGGAG